MLSDVVKQYVITSQRTGISNAARPVQMREPTSTELCMGRHPIEHFQPISEHSSVIIGGNPRLFVEAPAMASTGGRSQKPQYAPATMASPVSVPHMSGNTSETKGGKKNKTHEPLKMIDVLGHQKLPKDREILSVIICTISGLSVRT